MKVRPFAIAALISFGFGSTLALPAHATTLDASGVEFDFGNPGNADVLEDAQVGHGHYYYDVATIDGTVIDAVVTVVAVSDALVSTGDYLYVNQAEADILNGLNDPLEADLTPGCYSNVAYVSDPYSYFEGDFVAADRLSDGRISIVDEDQGSGSDIGINNDVEICTRYDEPSAPSSMSIKIEFYEDVLPVTLENVVLNVQDIDGGQSVTFTSPKPSSFELTSGSALEVTEDVTYTRFFGQDSSDDDPNFAADVRYDSISMLTYEFGFSEGAGGGSLSVIFESFVGNLPGSEPLASTGYDDTVTGIVVLAGFAFLAMGTLIARRRSSRGNAPR